jgi:hypothetical protein
LVNLLAGKMRNIIFLDIDGVLQPIGKQDRFNHDMDKLKIQLAAQYQDEEFLSMDKYDVAAVYYDWDKAAVERLRNLVKAADAEIIISSDWRCFNPFPKINYLFKIYQLDPFVTGKTPQSGKSRSDEVAAYLEHNDDVQNFVILDDNYRTEFEEKYPNQFVYCSYIFDDDCYKKALDILTNP